jgi:hypothetical protein
MCLATATSLTFKLAFIQPEENVLEWENTNMKSYGIELGRMNQ